MPAWTIGWRMPSSVVMRVLVVSVGYLWDGLCPVFQHNPTSEARGNLSFSVMLPLRNEGAVTATVPAAA
jgi:hypothetical protein